MERREIREKSTRKSSEGTESTQSSMQSLGLDQNLYNFLERFLIEARISWQDLALCGPGKQRVLLSFMEYSLKGEAFERVRRWLEEEANRQKTLSFGRDDFLETKSNEEIGKRVMAMVMKEIYKDAEECYKREVESRGKSKVSASKTEGPFLMMKIFYFDERMAAEELKQAKSPKKGIVKDWVKLITTEGTDYRLTNRILRVLMDEEKLNKLAEQKIRRALRTLLQVPRGEEEGIGSEVYYARIVKKITECKVTRPGKKLDQPKKPKLPKALILMRNAVQITLKKFNDQLMECVKNGFK